MVIMVLSAIYNEKIGFEDNTAECQTKPCMDSFNKACSKISATRSRTAWNV